MTSALTTGTLQKTALHERHRQLGAKMTEFHGWDMPLYYTSILEEHQAVRQALGLFDVSHMGQVLVTGPDAHETLNRCLVSDVTQVGNGRACYTLMLNQEGGILDDLIVYQIGEQAYLVIVNCGNRGSDVAWLEAHRAGRTTVADISQGRSIVAVQGPLACRVLEQLLDAKVAGLSRFGIAPVRHMGPEACIARTGYTGGDGFELFLPDAHAKRLWDAVLDAAKPLGARPVGLGARDTLRVEAGLRLYGTDMDAATSPLEVGLEWTVASAKPDFIGQSALARQRQQPLTRKFIGFELAQGPVPRLGTGLSAALAGGEAGPADGGAGERTVGTVTSGTFSPVLGKPLGMGYVEPAFATPGTRLTMTVRNQRHAVTVAKLPFWKGEAKPTLEQRS
jgi:aminomethyltransferase